MTPGVLLELFDRAFTAQRAALAPLTARERRGRTERAGQYHLDTVADAAIVPLLHGAGVRVLSEESGWTGPEDAPVVVVLDPVDGSTNCARNIPYWAISLCAIDDQGMLAALVANGATGVSYTAVRGEGSWVDGVPLRPSATEVLERSVVALTGFPSRALPWRQFRALGSSALMLCDVAAGNIDAMLDCSTDMQCPWDYLGALLVCCEAGAVVADAAGRELVVADPSARRRIVAAGNATLLDALVAEAFPGVSLTDDLEGLLQAARAAAAAGAEVVRDAYGLPHAIRAKGPGDWVSAVDVASEQTVRASLARDAPGIAFFGEETGGTRADVGWLVDPLDGTANFLHGLPVVGVSVALVEAGEPVVGVIMTPMLGDTYWARRGGGAFRNGDTISVSDRTPEHAISATGFPFRAKRERLDEYMPVFERALRTFEDLRRAGAASVDMAWTASGVLDGYFEQQLGPWDVAAGAVIVREAGGIVTDWAGDPRAWLTSGDVAAGSPAVHACLLGLIAGR